MQLRSTGIQFPQRLVNDVEKSPSQLQGLLSDISEDVSSDTGSSLLDLIKDPSELPDIETDPYIRAVSTTTDLTPILNWCNKEASSFPAIQFSSEYDNPDKLATTLKGTLDICNKFRSSLKPTFKALATRINEIDNAIKECDFNFNSALEDYSMKTDLENYVSKEEINNFIPEVDLANIIKKDEFARDDIIDVLAETDGTTITLTAEDTISEGMIVVKIYMSNAQKNFYIKIENGEITEYKGVSENITLGNIVIKPLARSEEFRASYLTDIQLNDKTITITNTNQNKISGVVIQGNSCTRHMTFTTNDFAYTYDIDALHKKLMH